MFTRTRPVNTTGQDLGRSYLQAKCLYVHGFSRMDSCNLTNPAPTTAVSEARVGAGLVWGYTGGHAVVFVSLQMDVGHVHKNPPDQYNRAGSGS